MIYAESAERSAELAEAAMTHMRQHGISPNPRNFMVWYGYFAGDNAKLRQSLDVLLQNNQEFTEVHSEEIYDEFFGGEGPDRQVRAWSARIEAAAGKILETLSASGAETEQYGRSLESYSGKFEGVKDGGAIRDIVAGILAETRTMEAQIQTLQGDVSASTSEITRLRANLESARKDAMTDGLTRLANRKCFDETLKEAAIEAVETGEPLSLVIADLDNFKKFNDTHGHQMGDQVLMLIGGMLVQSVKGQDTAARYGGEEFALILPNTDITGAVALAENIRQKVCTKKLVKKGTDEDFGPITLSMGVTSYASGEPLRETIRRADAALYTAKERGRNLVIADQRVKQPA